jgi:hypothetical protein
VEIGWAAIDELGNKGWNIRPGGPLSGEVADLLLGWNLTGQQEPKETFRQRFLTTGGFGEKLLAFGDGLATEADTLLGVENGALPDEGFDPTSTTVDLVEGDLADDLVSMFLAELLDLLNLFGQASGEGVLEGLDGWNSVSICSLHVWVWRR